MPRDFRYLRVPTKDSVNPTDMVLTQERWWEVKVEDDSKFKAWMTWTEKHRI
jgi:hypothetical protein